MTVHIWAALIAASLAFPAGVVWGRWTLERSLTLYADDPDSTPHRLAGRFYYLVPEPEYVALRIGYRRHRAARDEAQSGLEDPDDPDEAAGGGGRSDG